MIWVALGTVVLCYVLGRAVAPGRTPARARVAGPLAFPALLAAVGLWTGWYFAPGAIALGPLAVAAAALTTVAVVLGVDVSSARRIAPPPRPDTGPNVVLQLQGPPFPAEMRTRSIRTPYVEFACAAPSTALVLRVASSGWQGLTPRWSPPSAEVAEWGDWQVRASSLDDARRVLAPPARALLERIDQLHAGALLLELHADTLLIRDLFGRHERERPSDFIERCYELAALLRERLAAGPGLTAFDRVAGGRCGVCGTALADQGVACARCRTPHHAECWEYAGRCSVYACGSTSVLGV